MQQQVIQKQKKLSDIIKTCMNKYEKIERALSEGKETNKRCILGALMSEFGWNGDTGDGLTEFHNSERYEEFLKVRFSVDFDWCVNMNNSTTENNWPEILTKVEQLEKAIHLPLI